MVTASVSDFVNTCSYRVADGQTKLSVLLGDFLQLLQVNSIIKQATPDPCQVLSN